MHTSTNIASVDPDVFDLAFARARCGVEQWQISGFTGQCGSIGL